MSRSWRYRSDEPDSTQFVTVKGVGGLPVFALREDVRFFLSLLAREVRAGELGLCSFSFVRNHAHFLTLSPHGRLHEPLRRILGRFAVYYNRTRARVGHVFKDRFHSVCVRTEVHFLCCVGYTDHNPVKAGLATLSTEYEMGSAHHFTRKRTPRWLDPGPVSRYVPGADPETSRMPESSYLRVFCRMDYELVREFLSRRSQIEKDRDDPLDMFLSPDREGRVEWLVEQAKLADGSQGARLLARASILKTVLEEASGPRDWTRKDGASEPVRWRTLLIGLLRLGCARSCRQTAAMLGVSAATVVRETLGHLQSIGTDRRYLLVAEEILAESVRRTFRFLPPFAPVGPDGELKHE